MNENVEFIPMRCKEVSKLISRINWDTVNQMIDISIHEPESTGYTFTWIKQLKELRAESLKSAFVDIQKNYVKAVISNFKVKVMNLEIVRHTFDVTLIQFGIDPIPNEHVIHHQISLKYREMEYITEANDLREDLDGDWKTE